MLWCIGCGAEHEPWAEACAFCGGGLSGTAPEPTAVDHSTDEIDVGGLGPEQLAHLELLLISEGVPQQVVGGSLVVPAARTDVVTDCLAEVEAVGTLVQVPETAGEGRPPARTASTGRRVAARVLSTSLWFVVCTAVLFALVAVVELYGVIVLPEPLALVFDVVLVALLGWDFGKLPLGLRVVGGDDRPPGLWRALVRAVVMWGPFFAGWRVGLVLWRLNPTAGTVVTWAGVAWFVVLLVSISRHPQHRGWHDRAAGTHVLDVRGSSWTR